MVVVITYLSKETVEHDGECGEAEAERGLKAETSGANERAWNEMSREEPRPGRWEHGGSVSPASCLTSSECNGSVLQHLGPARGHHTGHSRSLSHSPLALFHLLVRLQWFCVFCVASPCFLYLFLTSLNKHTWCLVDTWSHTWVPRSPNSMHPISSYRHLLTSMGVFCVVMLHACSSYTLICACAVQNGSESNFEHIQI